jgi:hypothetical protein
LYFYSALVLGGRNTEYHHIANASTLCDIAAPELQIYMRSKMEQITISFLGSIRRAIHRARLQITGVAIVYILSILTGTVMVHQGNKFALNYGDKLVR